MQLADATTALEKAGYDADVDDKSDTFDFNPDNNTVCATRPRAGRTVTDSTVRVVATSNAEDCSTQAQRAVARKQDKQKTADNPATGNPDGSARRPTQRRARAGTALAALAELPVKGRAPKTGYDREQFGGDWASIDGCDMRQRILQRDLRRIIYQAGSDCEVSSGILNDRYSDERIIFHRGGASEVDIDHVVALGDAWQKGAQQWSYRRREQFANDPLNLLAADASANRSKGDADTASWLPPSKHFRCDYVARQIAVKRRYRAWVTAAEKNRMARALSPCSDARLPTSRRVRIPASPPPGEHSPEPTPEPELAKSDSGGARVFENCDAVRAAGRAPLVRGDGLYGANTHMDRDGDGVACE